MISSVATIGMQLSFISYFLIAIKYFILKFTGHAKMASLLRQLIVWRVVQSMPALTLFKPITIYPPVVRGMVYRSIEKVAH